MTQDRKATDWVLCKLGMTSKHQLIAKPGCGSGWTNNFQH